MAWFLLIDSDVDIDNIAPAITNELLSGEYVKCSDEPLCVLLICLSGFKNPQRHSIKLAKLSRIIPCREMATMWWSVLMIYLCVGLILTHVKPILMPLLHSFVTWVSKLARRK